MHELAAHILVEVEFNGGSFVVSPASHAGTWSVDSNESGEFEGIGDIVNMPSVFMWDVDPYTLKRVVVVNVVLPSLYAGDCWEVCGS